LIEPLFTTFYHFGPHPTPKWLCVKGYFSGSQEKFFLAESAGRELCLPAGVSTRCCVYEGDSGRISSKWNLRIESDASSQKTALTRAVNAGIIGA
jgi:hypothetical protein